MNLETLLSLSNGENLEIKVKVNDVEYPTMRDWIEVEKDRLIVSVTQPISNFGTPITDQATIDKLKELGYEEEKPLLESAISFLRTRNIFISVETSIQGGGIFSNPTIIHRGKIVTLDPPRQLILPNIGQDYNMILMETLKQSLS